MPSMPFNALPLCTSGKESPIDLCPLIVAPETRLAEVAIQMSQVRARNCILPRSNASLNLTATIWGERRSHYVLVGVGTQLIGTLTERDLVKIMASGTDLSEVTVAEAMQPLKTTLAPSEFQDILTAIPIERIAAQISLWHQQGVSHIPLLDEQGELIGVVTSDNLSASLLQLSATPEALPDLNLPLDLLELRTVATAMSAPVIWASATATILELAQMMAQHQVGCIAIAQTTDNPNEQIPLGIITERDIIQFQNLGLNLENLLAQVVMSAPVFSIRQTETLRTAHETMQQRWVRHLVVVGEQDELAGIVTQSDLLRSLDPVNVSVKIEALQRQVAKLQAEKNAAFAPPPSSQRGDRLLAAIALRIRQSLNLDEILQAAVEEVRHLLNCDRVIIYRFNPDWSGDVVVESVAESSLSILGMTIRDTCFATHYVEPYRNGRVQATTDIYNSQLQECYVNFLSCFQIKSNLVVPILQTEEWGKPEENADRNHLWGLLIAHQCQDVHQWQKSEIELVKQLATHLAIAIQQSELYQQLETELVHRVQVETALRQSEERFRNLVETTNDWVWELTENSVYTYASPRVRDILGYEPAEIIGKTPFNFMPWDEAARAATQFAEIATLQQPFSCLETTNRHKHGRLVILESSGVPFHDLDGTFRGYRGIARDITERKQAAIALQQAHQRLTFHVENSPLAIVEWDAFGRVQRWSPQAEKIFGWSAKEVIGKQPGHQWQFIDEQDLSQVSMPLAQLLNGSQPRAIARIRNITKSGKVVHCEWYNSALRDNKGTLISILSLVHDVTDRQLALDALKKANEDLEIRVERRTAQIRQTNERLRAEITERQKVQEALQFTQFTIDRAAESVFWIGSNGQLLDVNEAACRLLCYSREELLALTLQDIELNYPAQLWLERWQSLKQHQCLTFETYYQTKEGKVIPVEITANHLEFKGREYKCSFVRDITERKQAQAEILKALETERELSQLKSRIVSVVSHEYRTPLTTIYSSTELLEYYGPNWSEEKKNRHLQRIKAAVNHLIQLVDDVLILNKADEERLEFDPVAIDLLGWCQDLTEELQATAGIKHHIEFSYRGDCSNAIIDRKLLRQLLTNLLTNAIKYSPDGGTIQFNLEALRVKDSSAWKERRIAIFRIQDRGIGILEEDRSLLFESFHRGSNVGAIAGTGLGLAIVKKCVDLHQGKISVDSQVGIGTTFTVELPIG